MSCGRCRKRKKSKKPKRNRVRLNRFEPPDQIIALVECADCWKCWPADHQHVDIEIFGSVDFGMGGCAASVFCHQMGYFTAAH